MKLYKKLEYLSYRFRYEATYLEMKYHLKRILKGKESTYIKKIRNCDRNIGKSCALARLSVKYDIPVVVPTNLWATLYEKDIPRYIPKYFKNKKPNTIVANERTIGKRYDYILFEECITQDVIDNILTRITRKGMIGYKLDYKSIEIQ